MRIPEPDTIPSHPITRSLCRPLLSVLLLSCLCILLITHGSPVSGESPRTIILHGGDWDSLKLNNAIVSYILRYGYGYTPVIVPGMETMVGADLASGGVDISLEVWKENHPPELQKLIDTGKISDLGRIYDNATHTFIIPRHIAESYNISSIGDMQHYWSLCKDPEDPSRGLMYIGLISWLVHDSTLRKMDRYGLSPYYNPVTMPSGRAYEAAFMKAVEENRTIFGLYWTPSSVAGTGYWKVLSEPEERGSPSQSDSSAEESPEGTSQIFPFQSSDVHILISPGLEARAPELIPFLTAMKPGEEALSGILAAGYRQKEHNWDRLGMQYLMANKDRWQKWVSPDAYRRVSDALNQTAGQG